MTKPAFFVSDDFAPTILELHEQAGAQCLNQLPTLLADCAELWFLTLGLPFAPLLYNYVAPVVQADGTQAVLKLGVPERALEAEIEALRLFDSKGIVRLLNADPKRGALASGWQDYVREEFSNTSLASAVSLVLQRQADEVLEIPAVVNTIFVDELP